MFTDPKYPIYSFSWKWIQDGEHDPKYPDAFRYKDMPEGRIRNTMSLDKMYKEEQSLDSLKEWAHDYFLNQTELHNKKYQDDEKLRNSLWKNIEDLQIEVKFLRNESWCLTWFCHETFDVGQTDKEALDSFEEYVRRYEHMQRDIISAKEEYGDKYVCLMGAEDRWRWCGSDANGVATRDVKAPCRCAGCKDAGMLRINH